MILHSVPGPNALDYREGYPWAGHPGSKISDVWEMLELEDIERRFPRVELPVWVAFLLARLFCVFWPDKVPFAGTPEAEERLRKADIRIWRIIGAVCIAAALVLMGLYAGRIALEFYKCGAYLI